MNYHNILQDNMLNGEGLRVVLFVSGCTHNCKNCHNPQTHDFNSGIPFLQKDKEELFKYLEKPYIQGLTISGGDPLHPKNRDTILKLCKEIKEKFSKKDIWIYTGYTYPNDFNIDFCNEIKQFVDVIVDGKFIEKLKDVNLPYVGSSNQRIIYLKNGD